MRVTGYITIQTLRVALEEFQNVLDIHIIAFSDNAALNISMSRNTALSIITVCSLGKHHYERSHTHAETVKTIQEKDAR